MKKFATLFLVLCLLLTALPAALAEGDAVDIRYMYTDDSFDPNTDLTRTLIQEELGVNIIPEMYASTDQVTLILASDQEFDAIKINDTTLLGTYAKAGTITDLTDIIMANETFYNMFPKEVWDMVSVDGRIYAIPETDTQDIDWGIAVRKDWLDKCGLSLPTTVDEFYNMLVAFSQLNPADVGADYIIPFSMSGVNSTLYANGLIQAFGLGGGMHEFVVTEDGLKNGYQLPGGKEYVTFMNRLYQEGLLDADFPANQNSDVVERVSAGNVGCAVLCVWDSWARDTLKANNPDAELVYIGALTKEGYEENGRLATRGGLKNYLVVPATSTKAQDVVNYCVGFMDDAHYTRLILGDKGVHYEVKDGTYYPIFPAFNEMNKGRWFYPTNVGEKYTPLFAVRAHKEESMGYLWDNLNEYKAAHGYLEISHLCPLLKEYSDNIGTLTSLSYEYLIKMVLSADELAQYDSFVERWMAAGGESWINAMNQWYTSTH